MSTWFGSFAKVVGRLSRAICLCQRHQDLSQQAEPSYNCGLIKIEKRCKAVDEGLLATFSLATEKISSVDR